MVLLANSSSSANALLASSTTMAYFPRYVPLQDKVRLDPRTKTPVARNRIRLLGTTRHTLREFRELLQCPVYEPELYGRGGALHLASYLPVTVERLKVACAWPESGCTMWGPECTGNVTKFESGKYPKAHADKKFHFGEPFIFTRLFRVTSGVLYYDWPWGADRLKKTLEEDSDTATHARAVLGDVVRSISDLPDALFFVSQDIQVRIPPSRPLSRPLSVLI